MSDLLFKIRNPNGKFVTFEGGEKIHVINGEKALTPICGKKRFWSDPTYHREFAPDEYDYNEDFCKRCINTIEKERLALIEFVPVSVDGG